jgi:hypothetical protein
MDVKGSATGGAAMEEASLMSDVVAIATESPTALPFPDGRCEIERNGVARRGTG